MPAKSKELSALAVANLKIDGRYMVGGAVGLHIRKAGESRAWILRKVLNGKRCDIGLGSYPGVTLATARKLANKHHDDIALGVDPLAAKRVKRETARIAKAATKTFRECATLYVDAHKDEWKSEKHGKQWTATLERYAFPIIGKLPVASIDTAHIQSVFEQPVGDDQTKLWNARPETASRLRGRIEAVLDSAKAGGLRHGENPARWDGHLKHLLGKRQRLTRGHHAALPYSELGAFMVDLRGRDGTAARALEFGILCASRSGEVRGATFNEFDLDRALWTIPAERMKAAREHVVPLSAPAVALIRAQAALPRLQGVEGPGYVFPAPRGGALSDMALTAVLKRMGRADITQHGFRSTFREWAGEIMSREYPSAVVEHALAHQLANKVEAAYQRGNLVPPRIGLTGC